MVRITGRTYGSEGGLAPRYEPAPKVKASDSGRGFMFSAWGGDARDAVTSGFAARKCGFAFINPALRFWFNPVRAF
jgi:hypothetical protein